MKNEMIRRSLILVVCICTSLSAFGAQAPRDPEQTRAELLDYVSALQHLPPSMAGKLAEENISLPDAEQSIRALSAEELRMVDQAIANIPYWQELPALLRGGQLGNPRVFDESLRSLEADISRQQMIAMMDMLKAVPPELVPADYHQRLNNINRAINELNSVELMDLQRDVQARIPQWTAQLEGKGPMNIGAMNHCGSTWNLDKIKCEIGHIFSDLSNIPATIANFATSAVNSIKNGLLNFLKQLSAVLPTKEAFQSFMANASSILSQIPDAIRIPCLPDGFPILAMGNTGDLVAAQKWERFIAFPANVIEEATPDDVWSGNLKAVVAVINFIPQHILRCLQNSYQENYKQAQLEHRDWVEERLDVTATSRASALNVQAAQNKTDDVTSDVAAAEAKLDALGAQAGDIKDILIDLRTLLENFQTLSVRMRIEVDLLRQANKRISLFQLPQSFGGHLETARQIVLETLQKRAAAGVDVKKAMDDYNAGVSDMGKGNYKSAYTSFRKAYSRSVS